MNKVSAEQLDALQEDASPVLVKFGATWCGPCRALEPQLAKYSQTPDAVRVVEVDIDEQPALAARYGVMAVPTMILLQGGQPAARIQGVVPASKIAAEIAGAR